MSSGGTHVCASCSDNFIVNNKQIACNLCSKKYHAHCAKVKDQFLKIINECRNIFWFCDECVDRVKINLDVTKNLSKLEQQIEECRENTKEIIKNMGNATSIKKNEQWSDVVKRNPPLIIRPKNANQDSATTKNVLEKKIKPSDLSIEVNKVKTAGNGCIVVECDDTKSMQILQNKAVAELSANYDIQIPKMINPKITIVGVRDEYIKEEDVFVQRIKSQNSLKNAQNVEVKFLRKLKSKTSNRNNVLLEVSAEVLKTLLQCKKVFLDWDSCLVYEHLGVLRCYKCWKYGHKAAVCRQEVVVCPLCNKDHTSDKCQSDIKECTNCRYACDVLNIKDIKYDHTVFDKQCLSHQKAIERLKTKTQYI